MFIHFEQKNRIVATLFGGFKSALHCLFFTPGSKLSQFYVLYWWIEFSFIHQSYFGHIDGLCTWSDINELIPDWILCDSSLTLYIVQKQLCFSLKGLLVTWFSFLGTCSWSSQAKVGKWREELNQDQKKWILFLEKKK